MESTEVPSSPPFFTFLRSCKEEADKALDGEVQGEIPKWLKGCLIRVGSGLLEVGPDSYNHIFDGLALMHRFAFQDGKVTYQNRFLRSDAYKKNMKANRIVVNEFGTQGVPDPCKTIFQRFSSLFSVEEMTDNDLVNIVLYTDEVYACSETNCIWRIDPDTLESIQKVKLDEFVPVHGAIAHAHEDTDGTVYNVGSTFGFNSSFVVLKIPPKESKSSNAFEKASVVCRIPSSKHYKISYLHSFAMTENYIVIVEQPLCLSIPRMAWAMFITGAFGDAMHWDGSTPSRFHVVKRSTGELMNTIYVAKSFFVFHHINAYEEDNNLVIDMCCYEDGSVIKKLYVKALKEMSSSPESGDPFQSEVKRYVLPLITGDKEKNTDENLVTLPNSEATAYRQSDGSIFCHPEVLIKTEKWSAELPRINYEKYNGKKYRYCYAMARKASGGGTHLIKVDTLKKTALSWGEDGVTASEPVFISDPEQGEEEDSGVLLASLLYKDNECKVSMLVLNSKTMQEIGRVTFLTKSSVPGDFHGTFIQKK